MIRISTGIRKGPPPGPGPLRTPTRVAILSAILLTAPGGLRASSYHELIQRESARPIPEKAFKRLEKSALRHFQDPEFYLLLSEVYAGTTEKVWAVVYGEVFCNLTVDERTRTEAGAELFALYDGAVELHGDLPRVFLTENAQDSRTRVPFETRFELSLYLGLVGRGRSAKPLTIATLTEARRKQLVLWLRKELPQTELTRWQERIARAGHLEAYNYWLFRGARPHEFNRWLEANQGRYDAWLEWRTEHRLEPMSPDFQRPVQARRILR